MTSGKEDYLKAIYIISEDHELVSNKELSDILHVSPPSVSEMIMKLQKEGYVDYTAYKGSKMTRQAFPFSCVVGSIPCGKAPFFLERSS